jgi:hypothetical protein
MAHQPTSALWQAVDGKSRRRPATPPGIARLDFRIDDETLSIDRKTQSGTRLKVKKVENRGRDREHEYALRQVLVFAPLLSFFAGNRYRVIELDEGIP